MLSVLEGTPRVPPTCIIKISRTAAAAAAPSPPPLEAVHCRWDASLHESCGQWRWSWRRSTVLLTNNKKIKKMCGEKKKSKKKSQKVEGCECTWNCGCDRPCRCLTVVCWPAVALGTDRCGGRTSCTCASPPEPPRVATWKSVTSKKKLVLITYS